MADETTYGRRPIVVVEITQPRCGNRFGVSPCTADPALTPKCFNCYWTCLDRENYNTNGSITWRFTRPNDPIGWLYEETDANNIKTNAIPILISASHNSSRLNPGAARTGESPLGRRATAQVRFSNGSWDDHVGDFYLADRPERQFPAGFFDLLLARNPFYPDWQLSIYEGYAGQALAGMQKRVFDIEEINGPSNQGEYTVSCRDPLDRLRGKNTLYPPVSQIDVRTAVDASVTSIPVSCLESELSADYGNTGSTRYATIESEIITYTGWTGTEPDLTLTGVTRGALLSEAAPHDAEVSVQRGAYHDDQLLYDIARYIIQNHTTLPASYIDDAQWDEEGSTYLSTLRGTTFIAEPLAVDSVLGELCRDGLFNIWWDDRDQLIPLLAVRPPRITPPLWTDDLNVVKLSKTTKADIRMTRVTIFFGVRNWLSNLTEVTNFKNRRTRIDGEVESEIATGGKIVENRIFSRWITSFNNALFVQDGLLKRYRLPPQYITLELDAKDRSIRIGDAVDLLTREIRGPEGAISRSRWQLLSLEEPVPGSRIVVDLQSFPAVGNFSIIMANDAPVFADATEDERLEGCWLAGDNGLMPDGSPPYLLQ